LHLCLHQLLLLPLLPLLLPLLLVVAAVPPHQEPKPCSRLLALQGTAGSID